MSEIYTATPLVSEPGSLSFAEAGKSLRDILIVGLAYIAPMVLELIPMVDFGDWTAIISFALAGVSPFVNRWLNVVRIK